MADPRVPNQSELLAQLGMMVGLLERAIASAGLAAHRRLKGLNE